MVGSEYENKTLFKIDANGDLVRLDSNFKWQKILTTSKRLSKCVSFPDETVFLIGGAYTDDLTRSLKSVTAVKVCKRAGL